MSLALGLEFLLLAALFLAAGMPLRDIFLWSVLPAIACVGPERSSPTERVEVTSVEVVGEKKPEKKSEEKKK